MKYINVSFMRSRTTYEYKCAYDDIAIEDKVLTRAGSSSWGVAMVTAVNDVAQTTRTLKWIVQKVDTTEFDRLTAFDRENSAAITALKHQFANRKDAVRIQAVAEDKELASLREQIHALQNPEELTI